VLPSAPRLKLLVLGDSYSTNSVLPQYRPDCRWPAYPEVLATQLQADFEVLSLARPGSNVRHSLSQSRQILQHAPDLVLICHGGHESLIQLPRLLRFLPAAIGSAPRRNGWICIVDYLRRPLWWLCSAGLCRSSRSALAMLKHFGIRCEMDPASYEELLEQLVQLLLVSSCANILLVSPSPGRPRQAPWSAWALEATARAAAGLASSRGSRVHWVDTRNMLEWPEDFSRDGVHLSAQGHRRLARLVRRSLSEFPWRPLS
jgi:lysophospholipase L1-like esterase